MEPKLNVAVIFDQEAQSGGGFYQSISLAIGLKSLQKKSISIQFFTFKVKTLEELKNHGIKTNIIKSNPVIKFFDYFANLINKSRVFPFRRYINFSTYFESYLYKKNIDIVIFLSPSNYAKSLDKLNFIFPVWDLCHRDELEFPEVRHKNEIIRRDSLYKDILPRAVAIISESKLGKENLIRRYGIDEERIFIQPFKPTQQVGKKTSNIEFKNLLEKYSLDMKYIFYPAQFWAHKNHIYIIDAIKILKKEFSINLGVIFCGTDKGNLNYVKDYVASHNLEKNIRYAGYIDSSEINDLYKHTLALVMPTYFGPTNLPPLEAFQMEVPLIYPDKKGLRDQVGDAALLMNLTNPHSLALHLKELIENPKIAESLIQKGKEQLSKINKYDNLEEMREILDNFYHKRKCWKK